MIIECPHCGARQNHFWWDGLYHPDEPCVGPPNPPETVACDECRLPIPNPHAQSYPNLPKEDSVRDRMRYHNHPNNPIDFHPNRYPDLTDESGNPNFRTGERLPKGIERKDVDCDLCDNIGWIADGFMLDDDGEVLVEQYTGPCPECAVLPVGYYNE